MKQIFKNSIQNVGDLTKNTTYIFPVPTHENCAYEVDMAELLAPYKNETLSISKDPKLWNEVYSPSQELKLFKEILESALKNKRKVHIKNISLAEEIGLVKDLYLQWGYFQPSLNAFVPDFQNCLVTLGVNIRNLVYSFKDYYTLWKNAFFVPPPREPNHQKAIRSGLNAGVISAIHLNHDKTEKKLLQELLLQEKTNPLKLGRLVLFNLVDIGYLIENEEWIIELELKQ